MAKKFLASCLAALVLVFTVAPVSAAPSPSAVSITEGNGTARAEETRWYFRTTADGKNQMRLWSITFGRGLTDWITIN